MVRGGLSLIVVLIVVLIGVLSVVGIVVGGISNTTSEIEAQLSDLQTVIDGILPEATVDHIDGSTQTDVDGVVALVSVEIHDTSEDGKIHIPYSCDVKRLNGDVAIVVDPAPGRQCVADFVNVLEHLHTSLDTGQAANVVETTVGEKFAMDSGAIVADDKISEAQSNAFASHPSSSTHPFIPHFANEVPPNIRKDIPGISFDIASLNGVPTSIDHQFVVIVPESIKNFDHHDVVNTVSDGSVHQATKDSQQVSTSPQIGVSDSISSNGEQADQAKDDFQPISAGVGHSRHTSFNTDVAFESVNENSCKVTIPVSDCDVTIGDASKDGLVFRHIVAFFQPVIGLDGSDPSVDQIKPVDLRVPDVVKVVEHHEIVKSESGKDSPLPDTTADVDDVFQKAVQAAKEQSEIISFGSIANSIAEFKKQCAQDTQDGNPQSGSICRGFDHVDFTIHSGTRAIGNLNNHGSRSDVEHDLTTEERIIGDSRIDFEGCRVVSHDVEVTASEQVATPLSHGQRNVETTLSVAIGADPYLAVSNCAHKWVVKNVQRKNVE